MKKNHPELWNELKELDKINRAYQNFKYNETISDVELKVDKIIQENEEKQIKLV